MPEILKTDRDSLYEPATGWVYSELSEGYEDFMRKMAEDAIYTHRNALRMTGVTGNVSIGNIYTIREDIGSWIELKGETVLRDIKNSEEEILGLTFNPSVHRFKVEDRTIETPNALKNLENVVNDSKYILELEEGWDGEDGKPYLKETWLNAINFLIDYASWIYSNTGKIIASPDIVHSRNGSIDILWQRENFRMLINIPENSKLAQFYGDDYREGKVSGTFNLGNFKSGLALAISDLY